LPVEHLFVYGTLRRGSNNKFARLLADRAGFVGTARVAGLLYDFGSYPGAVRSDQPDHWVYGEVHSFDDPEILPVLDEYEGMEFERGMVTTSDTAECWIYWYVGPAKGRLIASGDWLKR
jgi:gamma-glutamylcyclotransferase (GGCT)/AIG2-like uncharacterized protein YtfP